MSQSHSAVYVHLIFSTKDRRPWFTDPKLRSDLHQYLGGTSNKLGCPIRIVGGVADHVHLLGCLSRVLSIADWAKELKRVSHIWLEEQGAIFKDFEWQRGYGAFSVSFSNLNEVVAYIANQEAHHKRYDFKDELRALLKRHEMEWDERYLWD